MHACLTVPNYACNVTSCSKCLLPWCPCNGAETPIAVNIKEMKRKRSKDRFVWFPPSMISSGWTMTLAWVTASLRRPLWSLVLNVNLKHLDSHGTSTPKEGLLTFGWPIWGTLRNNSGLRGMSQFGETRDGQVVKKKKKTDRTSTKEAFLVSFL